MSIKEIMKDPVTWASIVGTISAFFIGLRKSKVDLKKSLLETDSVSISNRIKEAEYAETKINKLLDRAIKAEKEMEEMFKKVEEMRVTLREFAAQLVNSQELNRQLTAEINFYKTIQS